MDTIAVTLDSGSHINVPEGHKCRRLHGHSFRVAIHVRGALGPKSGWVMDFADVGEKFQPLFERLDHHCLNDIEGLENPTSENLARWIWQRLKPDLSQLTKVVVRETCKNKNFKRPFSSTRKVLLGG